MTNHRTFALVSVVLLAGTLQAAAPPALVVPERLLPASTQVYIRWDGVKAHQDAYRRSAFGRIFAGEMGRSIQAMWGRYQEVMKDQVVGERLLEGAPPMELRQRNDLLNAALSLPEVLAETGFVVGFEVSTLPSGFDAIRRFSRMLGGKAGAEELILPTIQFTFILPNAMRHPQARALIRTWSAFDKAPGSIKKLVVQGRSLSVYKGTSTEMGWAWWQEGKHLVLVGAMGDPVLAVERVLNAGDGLTRHPLYRTLRAETPFRVTTRGLIDGKAIGTNLGRLRFLDPQTVATVEEMGLRDIEAVRFWEGFEGEVSRARWEVDIASRQRGATQFLVKKSINLKDLPPIPDDAYRWTAARINLSAGYDMIITMAAASMRGEAPPSGFFSTAAGALVEAKKRTRQEIDDAIGVKFEDLLGSLGDTLLAYCSPSDGFMSLGQVVAVKVLDERKLIRTMDTLMSKLASNPGANVRFRKQPFHGVTIREVGPSRGGSPVRLAYAVHKGWLVLALNQQPVQGFILRSQGKLPVWKPDRRTEAALSKIPAQAGLVQVVDPEQTVNLILAGAPAIAGLISRDETVGNILDPGLLPHARAVTKHLFPNVSWTKFDGRTWRIESRESLWLPFQEIGMEWMFFAGGVF